jgi:hypothetical protein
VAGSCGDDGGGASDGRERPAVAGAASPLRHSARVPSQPAKAPPPTRGEARAQAPEEVYQAKRKRTELLGAGDKDSGDAKRMRANKKRKKRDANKRREAAARARGEAPAPRLNKGKQETTKGGRESAGREEDSAGHKAGDLGKSSTLFRALQAEAMGAVHGKTRDDIGHSSGAKGKKGKGGSSKLKL